MKEHGQHLWGQRILALLSVLAVVVGLTPHEGSGRRANTQSLAPAPLPELRAFTPLPPLTPHEFAEPPAQAVQALANETRGDTLRPVRKAEHAPQPREQSGIRQLEGG